MQIQRYKDSSVCRWNDVQDDPLASNSASDQPTLVVDDYDTNASTATTADTQPQQFRKLKQLCPRGFKCKTLLPCPYRHPKRRF